MAVRRHKEGGFTLLELLVSMTLLALIGVAAASSVRFGLAVWDRGGEMAEASLEDRALQKYLSRQIAGARAILIRDGTRNPPVFFTGEARRVELIASLPARLAPPGDHLVALELGGGALGPRPLLLRWSPVGASRPELSGTAAQEVLLSDATDLRFRFFGRDASGAANWQTEWRGRETLPLLVEIAVERAGGDVWPKLVIRLEAA